MQCPKCNKEFSDKVLPLHLKRCPGKDISSPESPDEPQPDLSKLKVDELKALAKERGIENYNQMVKAQLIECLMTPKEQ